MGATVETHDGCPPLTITGGKLRGIDYCLPVASAQVKSAILLAGLYAKGLTTVRQPGPTRNHTELMLTAQGVEVEIRDDTVRLSPPSQSLDPFSVSIPSDFSSAAFPLVAALLAPHAELTLQRVGINPTRTGLLEVLTEMGAGLVHLNRSQQGGEPVADLTVRSSELRGVEVSGAVVVRMIDEFPVLAVAATQAEGETLVRDAGELRVKETDRISAVVAELRALGASVQEREDGFVVHGPTQLRGARVHSHGDHRLAMALVVAGLIAQGETLVDGAEVIADSFPGFVSLLRELGAEIE
jgi:3-phosphoshikimate 1-carboxyvinyltransferase